VGTRNSKEYSRGLSLGTAGLGYKIFINKYKNATFFCIDLEDLLKT
jgi:hypothetical protein